MRTPQFEFSVTVESITERFSVADETKLVGWTIRLRQSEHDILEIHLAKAILEEVEVLSNQGHRVRAQAPDIKVGQTLMLSLGVPLR